MQTDDEERLTRDVAQETQRTADLADLLRLLYHGGRLDCDETQQVEDAFQEQGHPL